ncbi:MAG: hypothetical protein DMG65_16690 [Candidatus Angelobacter sp. Gp1-AA117]|nr:MAG: hypothetical protein DMG65_16690 [Candidatus Angelobacter sp. Gp1-AA117]
MTGTSVLKRLALITAVLFAVLLTVLSLPARPAGADDDDESAGAKFSAEAAATFNKRCTACHTFGKGVKVGPDLKDVTKRRDRPWLHKFIRGSSSVIASGDSVATKLFAEFRQQRMPDWVDLSEKQVDDILDYLAMSGPDIKPADERNAELATAADVDHGRKLFLGETALKYGSEACITCHAVEGAGLRNGSLGPNLTDAYERYQDLALTAFLRKPCFRWQRGSADHYLTAKESFAIKAFLRDRSVHHGAGSNTGSHTPVSAQVIPGNQKRGNQ